MRYLPHTPDDIAAMLAVIGIRELDDLFASVPEASRPDSALDLPEPLDEQSLNRHMDALSGRNAAGPSFASYLGAGCYEHFIPHAVTYLMGRSEFVTAYTPYQPELSQGTLQGIYEYQTLACRLLGMEVSNGSLYDGASALAEALLMAIRITKRRRVALSSALHPYYRDVAATYLGQAGFAIEILPYEESGGTDLSSLGGKDDLAAVAVQSPNFFGCIEDIEAVSDMAHGLGALSITAFSEPLAYGLYKNPGGLGADIVCGEGRSFGLPMSYGGSSLGMFAARREHVRQMPGRIVGRTTDRDGRPGFVITLATREQHIRRERATSNICTNQSLCALTAAAHLSFLGKTGLRDLAKTNYDRAEYLKSRLAEEGIRIRFPRPTFNEFVAEFPGVSSAACEALCARGTVPGLPLGAFYPELADCRLFCVTETKTRDDIDTLVREVASCMKK